jgi:hypothetical protein
VQGTDGVNFSVSSIGVTWSRNTIKGSVIACYVWWDDGTTTVSGVSDSVAGTFADSGLGVQRYLSVSAQMFYKENIVGGTKTTVTATFSKAVNASAMLCEEISGRATVGALDQKRFNTQIVAVSTTDAITSGTVETTTNGQHIFAVTKAKFNTNPSVGTNFTAFTMNHTTHEGEYLTVDQGRAGTVAATYTDPAGNGDGWITGIMTFKAAGGNSGARSH